MRRLWGWALLAGAVGALGWVVFGWDTTETRKIDGANGATRQGIGFQVGLRGGMLHLQLADAASGEALRGARPRLWLQRGMEALDEAGCRNQIRRWTDGRLSERADIDANGWRILTRNDDNTLSVINPEAGFQRTRLEALITLAGRSEDWSLSPNGKSLYVTVPEQNLLSFVDLGRFRVEGSVAVGRRPGTVAVSPDGKTVWVANEGDGTVSIVDAGTRNVVARLDTDPGQAHIAFHEAAGEVWIATSLGETVRIFDASSWEKVGAIEIGAGIVALQRNPVAQAIYVARASGEVLEIDPAARQVARRLQAEKGTTALGSDPSGRWLMATNRQAGTLQVIDASAGKTRSLIRGLEDPDAISFSKDFTYVRTGGTGALALVETASLGTDHHPTLIEVTVGQRQVAATKRGGVLAKAPIPGTFVVAHAADRAIYLYGEGMMAPIATHLNAGRAPEAVMVLDRSLEEAGPGGWISRAPIAPGSYLAAVLLDSPRVGACFPVVLEGKTEPERTAPPAMVWDQEKRETLVVGKTQPIRFRLEAPDGRDIQAEEVDVLVFRMGGNHQWHLQAKGAAGGFEVDFQPPLPGRYRLLAGVAGESGHMRAFELTAKDGGSAQAAEGLR